MKTIVSTVKGARDFYPQQMAIRNWLYHHITRVSRSYGYEEYDGPFLEKIELYAAKSGEELVKEQAFVFPDRGGELITLRPELTPSLARMVAQKQGELLYPLRWWSFGPFWRYEKPQKGRSREFFQWNIDLIGVDSPEADAELIAICADFFRAVGLTPDQVQVFVNDRQLMDAEFDRLGIPAELKKKALHLIDRREKMSPEAWKAYAAEEGFSDNMLAGLAELLEDKQTWKQSPRLARVFEILKAAGAVDYVAYEPRIVRGLEYYTGVVFEAKEITKEGRSILGGGHYGNLVSDVGGDPLPGVGFAMGDMMIQVVLEKFGLLPAAAGTPAEILVTVFDESLSPESARLAADLRGAGLNVVTYPDAQKLPRQFKFADKIGVRFVLVVGPDEVMAGTATVKDLSERTQEAVAREKVAEYIKTRLAG